MLQSIQCILFIIITIKKSFRLYQIRLIFFQVQNCKIASQFILLLEPDVAFSGSSKFSLYNWSKVFLVVSTSLPEMKTLTDARNYSKSRNPHDRRALTVLAFSQADISYQSQRPQGGMRLLFNSQFCYYIHDKVI